MDEFRTVIQLLERDGRLPEVFLNSRTIITALLVIVAILTAKAQLTDWQNISSKNFVTKIIHDENYLYVGTKGSGLLLFDGSKWTQYTTGNSQLPSDYVGFVAVDNDNVLWLNCRDPRYPDKMGSEFGLGLTRFDGNTWTTYNGNNSPLPSNCFWDVQVDADNRLWLATAGDLGIVGLTCFDGNAWTIYNTSNSGIVLNEVTKITLDLKRDLIWLTHHPGLGLSVARLNSHNTAIQSIAAPNAANTTIYDLSGRQVTNPTKGIYIKQGKKYVKE